MNGWNLRKSPIRKGKSNLNPTSIFWDSMSIFQSIGEDKHLYAIYEQCKFHPFPSYIGALFHAILDSFHSLRLITRMLKWTVGPAFQLPISKPSTIRKPEKKKTQLSLKKDIKYLSSW